MANAVRKICTKIGNGHQYLLGSTVKTSAYGAGPLMSDPVHSSTGSQIEKLKYTHPDHSFRPSQPICFAGPVLKNKQSMAAAVEWYRQNRSTVVINPASPSSTVLKSSPTKLANCSSNAPSTDSNDTSNSKGLPSADQLETVCNRLAQDLPKMFKENLDFSMYHPNLIFENNIRGSKTVGLAFFMTNISILRLMGHLKYAYVKFEVLKITKHPEDGTLKVRWRINGISGMKVFFKFWKFRLWNFEQIIKENIESWHDGFSVFYLGSDGLIHKLTADKMQPDNDPVIEEKNPLAAKLALILGLAPQLNV